MPEVNLVPTIDVIMCVLTFFVILSLTLNGQSTNNLELPKVEAGGRDNTEIQAEILSLSLNREGELFWQDRPLSEVETIETVQTFLAEYPEGKIVLAADRQLPYQHINQLLQQLGEIGGDRVSLSIQ
ncbi:MAG: biopolymer transporter ExbD [Cyanobacteria bacterium SBLK]|nr:biopolymer transporter ExbD [Cyanobacteria bacterium SBLK]